MYGSPPHGAAKASGGSSSSGRATGLGSVAIEKSNSRYPRRTPGHATSTRASGSAQNVGTWERSSSETPERLGVAQLATKELNNGGIVVRSCGVAQWFESPRRAPQR